jgi:2-oxoglutarate ferredoxin oxidoreductase subunit gamma
MTERAVIISGFGGQGLLFAGTALARAAMAEGREVLWIPSYGPEMRGGSAACTVIVGDRPIGSPVVDRADAVVALTRPAVERYARLVDAGGLLIVDADLVEESGPETVDVIKVPCTVLARASGDDRLVSVVALGVLCERRSIVAPAAVRTALADLATRTHPELLEANLAAFAAGMRAAAGVEAAGVEAAR